MRDDDVAEASDVMQVAYARAHALVEKAEYEAEQTLESARATGRGIVAEAERDAAALREQAAQDREEARRKLLGAKRLVAKAREQAGAPAADIEPTNGNGTPPIEPTALGEPIALNEASAEDLRVAGLSVTQARRVIARREREGPYTSIEQLAELPGMPAALIQDVRSLLTV